MKRILALLIGSLAIVGYVGTRAPMGAKNISLTAAGDTLIAKWAYKTPLQVTDTALVVWSKKAGTSTAFTAVETHRTRLTTDKVVILMPDPGTSDTIKVCVRVRRIGAASDSPNVCAQKGRSSIAIPSPIDSLEIATVTQIVVRPVSASLAYGAQQQFCAFAVMSNGARVKTENSINNAYCEQQYQLWLAERSA